MPQLSPSLTNLRQTEQPNGGHVIERDDGIQGELAVVHAVGKDDMIVAVGRFGADPGHIGALARIQLGRGLEEDRLAVLEFLAFRQVLFAEISRCLLGSCL